MIWTAVVPLKAAPNRKPRLGPGLALQERIDLSDHMARHVIASLKESAAVGRVLLLSPAFPDTLEVEWLPDNNRGINTELGCFRAGQRGPIVVVNADLPLLLGEDIDTLLAAAEDRGVAIAPDRHGEGTNAIALADERPFRFAFGPGSFRAHSAEASCVIVRRAGLAFDIDSPADLEAARTAGLLDRVLCVEGSDLNQPSNRMR